MFDENDEYYKNKYLKYKSKYLNELYERQIKGLQQQIQNLEAAKNDEISKSSASIAATSTLKTCVTNVNDPQILEAQKTINELRREQEVKLSTITKQISELNTQIKKTNDYSGEWDISYLYSKTSYDRKVYDTYDFAVNLLMDLFSYPSTQIKKYQVKFTSRSEGARGLILTKKANTPLNKDIVVCSNASDINQQRLTTTGLRKDIESIVGTHYNYGIFKCIFFNILYGSHQGNNIYILNTKQIIQTFPVIALFYDFLLLIRIYTQSSLQDLNNIFNSLGFDTVTYTNNTFNYNPLNTIISDIAENKITGMTSTEDKQTGYIQVISIIKDLLFKKLLDRNVFRLGTENYIPEIDLLVRLTRDNTGKYNNRFKGSTILNRFQVFQADINRNNIHSSTSYTVRNSVTHTSQISQTSQILQTSQTSQTSPPRISNSSLTNSPACGKSTDIYFPTINKCCPSGYYYYNEQTNQCLQSTTNTVSSFNGMA